MKHRTTRLRERITAKRATQDGEEIAIGLRVDERRAALWGASKLREVVGILIECGVPTDNGAEIKRWVRHLYEQGLPLLQRIGSVNAGLGGLDDRVMRVLQVMVE